MTHLICTPTMLEFPLGEYRYVCLEYIEKTGTIEVDVCIGPDERDVYQRDVSGSMSVTVPKELTPDFLVAVQTWIEQLPIGGGDGARGHRDRAAVES